MVSTRWKMGGEHVLTLGVAARASTHVDVAGKCNVDAVFGKQPLHRLPHRHRLRLVVVRSVAVVCSSNGCTASVSRSRSRSRSRSGNSHHGQWLPTINHGVRSRSTVDRSRASQPYCSELLPVSE